VAFQIGVGAGGSEVLQDTGEVPFGPSSGVAATQATVYKPIFPPVPVANGARIAVKTASSIASALGWVVTLECVAQANVVDDTIPESVSVAKWLGTVPNALISGRVDANMQAVAASLLPVKKNTALAGVTFLMFDSTDGRTPKPAWGRASRRNALLTARPFRPAPTRWPR
jgi:hypothetical protein